MKKVLIYLSLILIILVIPYKTIQSPSIEGLYKLNISEEQFVLDYNNIYGTHLNFKGYIKEVINNIENISLVFYGKNGVEKLYNLKYEVFDDKTLLTTGDVINEGVDLEKLQEKEHVLLIEVVTSDETKYYTFNSDNDFDEVKYYSITKKNKNNLITFKNQKNYYFDNLLVMSVKREKLPDNVYDIIIDPGHGYSVDIGASYEDILEGRVVYEISEKIKTELEKYGYKVFMTRNEFEDIYNYGDDGRVLRAFNSHGKILLSIHNNSSVSPIDTGGLEIYTPNDIDPYFASLMADNIVEYTEINYSDFGMGNKLANGVFQRLFTTYEIKDANEFAYQKGYKPYGQTTNTPYYFMVRETGGAITHAYVDGRNEKKELNPYYNSNVGIESYLLELGYLNVSSDRYKLINSSDLYAKAIVDSVKKYLEC